MLLDARLSNVLQAGESVRALDDVAFRDGQFEVMLTIGDGDTVAVFEMRDIAVDAKPVLRIDIPESRSWGQNPCAPGDTWRAGLQVHAGELTYLTTKREIPAQGTTLR